MQRLCRIARPEFTARQRLVHGQDAFSVAHPTPRRGSATGSPDAFDTSLSLVHPQAARARRNPHRARQRPGRVPSDLPGAGQAALRVTDFGRVQRVPIEGLSIPVQGRYSRQPHPRQAPVQHGPGIRLRARLQHELTRPPVSPARRRLAATNRPSVHYPHRAARSCTAHGGAGPRPSPAAPTGPTR